jgi:zona occludens toxin (predicted ATPase)
MLTLITGKPGAGKSWYAVRELRKELAKGRAIFSDIDGLTLDGVLPIPERWQDCPAGSLVVYDECQKLFGPDKQQGRSSNPMLADLETHRHLGLDLWFITQHPGLLHAHVRRLIGAHVHVLAVYGSDYVRLYSAGEVIEVDKTSALLSCDCKSEIRDKSVFASYKSTVLNTHKTRWPRKTLVMLGSLLVGGLGVAVAVPYAFGAFNDKVVHAKPGQSAAPASAAAVPGVSAPASVPAPSLLSADEINKRVDEEIKRRADIVEHQPVACLAKPGHCVCYEVSGAELRLPESVCLASVAKYLGRLRGSSEVMVTAPEPGPMRGGIDPSQIAGLSKVVDAAR